MPSATGLGDEVANRYQRGFEVTIVLLIGIWCLGGNLVTTLPFISDYRPLAVEVAAWLAMAAIGVLAAVRLLRGRADRKTSWLLAAGTLVASAAATYAVPADAVFEGADWSWDAGGWIAVLILLRRPLPELGAVVVANSSFTLALLLHGGAADRASLTRFGMVTYATTALQIALVLAYRALTVTTRRAALAAEAEAAVRRRRQLAEEMHARRQERYQAVRGSVTPLLAGLARGDLDPADREVQHRCAVEASRLRRLLAESDDVPDPLLHELRACADIADRRGVLVDLQALGHLPPLDAASRRALTEAPLHALAGADRRARVTVVGRSDEVAVSVLADGHRRIDVTAPPDSGVTVTTQEGEDGLWVEARWRR